MTDEDVENFVRKELKPVVDLTDDQVRKIIAQVLCQGARMETPLSVEDKRPLEELFKLARDNKQDIYERHNAKHILQTLGLLKKPEDLEPAELESPFDLLGYIRTHNLFARVESTINDSGTVTSEHIPSVDADGDGTIQSVNTVPAHDFFDAYTDLGSIANGWTESECEIDGFKKELNELLTALFRPAVAEYGDDAKRIAEEACELTLWCLHPERQYPGVPTEPVDLHSMLESSILAWQKRDLKFSNETHTASSAGN
ncbi:hypothetical protein NCC49_006096 [Naganishia albida]|nr:hypothetical protein NCC49_006096 [Naganishia albida]